MRESILLGTIALILGLVSLPLVRSLRLLWLRIRPLRILDNFGYTSFRLDHARDRRRA
jgi:hypothetical protein